MEMATVMGRITPISPRGSIMLAIFHLMGEEDLAEKVSMVAVAEEEATSGGNRKSGF